MTHHYWSIINYNNNYIKFNILLFKCKNHYSILWILLMTICIHRWGNLNHYCKLSLKRAKKSKHESCTIHTHIYFLHNEWTQLTSTHTHDCYFNHIIIFIFKHDIPLDTFQLNEPLYIQLTKHLPILNNIKL